MEEKEGDKTEQAHYTVSIFFGVFSFQFKGDKKREKRKPFFLLD